ncbi:hypothetical protein KA005_62035 [bacterium]|nr:hypothetical protein [bacterium]
MKKVLRKSNLVAGILVVVVVCLGIVLAGDVIVKEGTIEGEVFKSTGCTATGTKAVAFGDETVAIGNYSTAFGNYTEASGDGSTAMGLCTTAGGDGSTAMGVWTTADGFCSTAMGYETTAGGARSTAVGYFVTAGPAHYTTAIGESFTNNVESSFAVGFGQKDFSVKSGDVHVYGKLTVDGDTDPKTLELELQERDGVIDRYEKYVTPGKKSGVVYINSETKQIEIYYPYVGVIKNMLGETIYTLPSIRINNNYENYYVFDTLTGQIVEKQRAIYDKYRIKEGIEFDSTTGQFIDQTSKETIPKEEAIELYK